MNVPPPIDRLVVALDEFTQSDPALSEWDEETVLEYVAESFANASNPDDLVAHARRSLALALLWYHRQAGRTAAAA